MPTAKDEFTLTYLAAFNKRQTVWNAAFIMSELNGIKPHGSRLYRALHHFINNGWIRRTDNPPQTPRRAKYYTLTDAGRNHLRAYLAEQLSPLRVIEQLLSEE